MQSFKGIFECRWCLSEIVDPVVLPCGESVCEKHEKDLRKTKGKCLLCLSTHRITSSQHFPENKALSTMLEMNLAKLDFGPHHKEAKEQVEEVEALYDDLKQMFNEPDAYVTKHTEDYTTKYFKARGDIINIINNARDRILEEINKFRSECKASITIETKDFVELQKSLEPNINKWREKLDELVVNESLWKEIAKEAQSAQEQIKPKLRKNAFEPPLALRHLTDSVKKDAWLELSKSLQIPEMNISEMRDKKSVLIRGVSKIAKAESWKQINSEEFTIQGFPFYLNIEFSVSDGKMWLGAYLFSRSRHEEQTVEVSRKFNVYGKHYQLIRQTLSCKREYDEPTGWGFAKTISLDDIMAHSAYDPEEDMVRVEVEIDEKSVQVKDKVSSTQQ